MPLRRTLLYFARQPNVRSWVETSPLAKRLSSRFIAGSTLGDALEVALTLQRDGVSATLDYLGENVTSPAEAVACRDTYLRMLNFLFDAGLEPNVSIKLTQFGIDFSIEDCEANVAALVKAAANIRGFVRVDMEASQYTERTLGIVRRVHREYGACGAVLQAYLLRSAADLEPLIAEGVRVRLCKGAYLEPPEVAFPDKGDVDRNYLRLAQELLLAGTYPAIATHDERVIEKVERFAASHGIARDHFEFQMLYGIRRELQKRLVQDGYRLRLYVPFGEAWYPYFMRRLAERPANLLFLARNLLRP